MEMDAIRITAIIKELLKLLRNLSESGEDYLFCIEYELEELKKELGSILVPDCDCVIYEGS